MSADAVDELPVIDIAGLAGGGAAGRRAVAGAVGAACEASGFFQVTGHGVPEAVLARAFEQARRFFALPDTAKRRVAAGGGARGWRDFGTIALPGYRPDLKEVFDFALERPADDPDVVAGHPLAAPNAWPDLDGFRPALLAYLDAVAVLGHRLLPVFAEALDLAPDFFDRPLTNMRIMRYPPLPAARPDDQFSTAPHADFGMLTLLAQDAAGGLEVQRRAGDWVAVPPRPGALVVNIGDMLACWTNDRFTSTPHRVVNDSGGERYSIPLFFNPRADALVECLPGCSGPGNPPRYRPITCDAYILGKYRQIFADTA